MYAVHDASADSSKTAAGIPRRQSRLAASANAQHDFSLLHPGTLRTLNMHEHDCLVHLARNSLAMCGIMPRNHEMRILDVYALVLFLISTSTTVF